MKAVVAGSINMDLVVKIRAFPRPGETCTAGEFARVPGGKGANQAVALSRLGIETHFVGAVGKDAFGEILLSDLRQDSVQTDGIRRVERASTGTAFILLQEDGQNCIVVAQGANGALRPSDLASDGSLWAGCSVAMTQLEIPLDTVEATARLAKENGALSVLDAGPPRPLHSSLVSLFDVISPNETEAEAIVGIRPTDETSASEAADRLLAMGCGAVVLKMGHRGAFFAGGGTRGMVPAIPVHAIDTTAAGDAFTAALAFKLALGEDLRGATRYAAVAGACATMVLGARPSMPTRSAVEALCARS